MLVMFLTSLDDAAHVWRAKLNLSSGSGRSRAHAPMRRNVPGSFFVCQDVDVTSVEEFWQRRHTLRTCFEGARNRTLPLLTSKERCLAKWVSGYLSGWP